MTDRVGTATTNGGLSVAEASGVVNFAIAPTNIAIVTTIAGTDYVAVSVSGVIKLITRANLATVLAFLTAETDPIFVAHAAYGVTAAKITNWDTAYGWGNHTAPGYLTTTTHDTTDRHTLGTYVPHDTLDGLSTVTLGALTDNDILAYDSGTGDWKNQSAAQAGLATSAHVQSVTYGGTGQNLSASTGYLKVTAGVVSAVAFAPSLVTGLTVALPFVLHGDAAVTISGNAASLQAKIKIPTGFSSIVGVDVTSVGFKSGSAGSTTVAVNNVAYDGGGSPITVALSGTASSAQSAAGNIAVTGGSSFGYVFISALTGEGPSTISGLVWISV